MRKRPTLSSTPPHRLAWLLSLLAVLLLSACGSRPQAAPTPEPFFTLNAPTATPRPADAPLLVLGHFRNENDAPAPEMVALLERFEQQYSIQVEYEATAEVAERLRELVTEGRSPDIILLPVPSWLREMAGAGAIPPLDAEVAATVRENFGPAWIDLVSNGDDLYGVPLDANAKSLLWYRLDAWTEWEVEPPETVDDLFEVADAIHGQNETVFAVPGEPGWPLTDWFESTLLATAGPELYDALVAHQILWTDPAVEAAAETFVSLLRDEWLMGGAERAVTMPLRTEPFAEAFDPEAPGAAMWLGQGGVVRSQIAGSGSAEEDFSFFPFPAEGGIVGVGAVAVGTNSSAATMALLGYLATPEAVQPWVEAGGFISPNLALPLDSYPSDLARQEANLLRETTLFRYDLSDLLPPTLTNPFLYEQLRAMLLRPDDLPTILAEIEIIAHREQGAAEP